MDSSFKIIRRKWLFIVVIINSLFTWLFCVEGWWLCCFLLPFLIKENGRVATSTHKMLIYISFFSKRQWPLTHYTGSVLQEFLDAIPWLGKEKIGFSISSSVAGRRWEVGGMMLFYSRWEIIKWLLPLWVEFKWVSATYWLKSILFFQWPLRCRAAV